MEKGLGYQSPARELKGVYSHGDTDSGEDEHRKKLYMMYGGSSELVSRKDVKTLRREVLSVKPGVPKAAPHQRWMNTTISFGPSDCPENMAGAGVLPLVTAPVISNVRLYHVLIDGGAGLNAISYAAFKQLQIPESKLTPSRPFSGVGASFCRSRSGPRRTSAQRAFCSMLLKASRPLIRVLIINDNGLWICLLYTSPSPRDS